MASKIRVDNITNLAGSGSLDVEVGIDISGDINFTGSLLKNGQPFASLPEQDPTTSGAFLMSNGTSAYWATPTTFGNPGFSSTQLPAGNADTGGINLQNPVVQSSGYYPFTGQGSWYDNSGNIYNLTIGSEFKYRSIFTHGFLSGGYRGANPWRTVNQTFHATDVTICRGDQLDRAAAYVDGNFGDYNGYIYGGANGWSPNGPHTSSINLHTGTGRTAGSSPDYNHTDNYGTTPDSIGASWDLYGSQNDGGATSGQTVQRGYITGGGDLGSQSWNRMNFHSELISRVSGGHGSDYCSKTEGELRGYSYSDTSNSRYIEFASESTGNWSTSNITGDGWKKSLSTKWNIGYHGNGNNVTQSWMKFTHNTGSRVSNFNQNDVSSGEENMQMGQDWGYMLGNYSGGGGSGNARQNNRTFKLFHATDSMTMLGFKTEPKGHQGQSSGACHTGAFTVTATRYQ
jgi:hypothetical protein